MPWARNLLRDKDVKNVSGGGRSRGALPEPPDQLSSCGYPHKGVSYLVNWDLLSERTWKKQ